MHRCSPSSCVKQDGERRRRCSYRATQKRKSAQHDFAAGAANDSIPAALHLLLAVATRPDVCMAAPSLATSVC